jgi:thioredoxin-related protein
MKIFPFKNRWLKTSILVILVGLCSDVFAQKINFIEGSLSDALTKAKEMKLPVFVDAYAVWCGPCKRMDKEVFTEKNVADYFNSHYVSIKIDMEQGEGPSLSEIYGVRAYPTFLFLNENGEAIHKIVGFYRAAEFLEAAKVASDPEKQIATFNKKYAAGERSPEFLMEYFNLLEDVYDPASAEVLDQYLSALESWDTPEARYLVFNAIELTEGSYWEHFVSNKDIYLQEQGLEAFEAKIFSAVLLKQVFDQEPQMEQAEQIFVDMLPERAHLLMLELKMDMYKRNGNHEDFARVAIERHLAEPIENPYLLNNIAWELYATSNNKKQLKQAIAMAETSVKATPLYSNLDTLSALYQKMGKKKQARKYAKEAILIARQTGEDYSDTQERAFGKKALKF